MRYLVHIKLLSDAIFGSGMSMPGGEDICILTDSNGFPYMKGSTLKGIFREELINYLEWCGHDADSVELKVNGILGKSGSDEIDSDSKLQISDLTLDSGVIKAVLTEGASEQEIIDAFSYTREFTRLENGLAKDGSLRSGRCIKKGLNFYAVCSCNDDDKALVKDVFEQVKWIGSMRNRGFGKVSVEVEELNE